MTDMKLKPMDVVGPVSGHSQKDKETSYKCFLMDFEKMEEPEEHSTKRPYKMKCSCTELKDSISKMRQQCGNSGSEPELCGAESLSLLPLYPACVSQDSWAERGEDEDVQDNLLHPCCTAEGSIDQESQSSMLEYSVYLDEQHIMADCSLTSSVNAPITPVTHRPCLFTPVPSSVTTIASTMISGVNPPGANPSTDTCSAISSMSSPTASAWDVLRSTSRSLDCSRGDPVSAAAHLHLLGESMSLIGHHLQETDKVVCVSSSLSLLLDSLLCALAPLISLSAQIPELKSCTQHSLAATHENIAYLMPGL